MNPRIQSAHAHAHALPPRVCNAVAVVAAFATLLLTGCATAPAPGTQTWVYRQAVVDSPADSGRGATSLNTLLLNRPAPDSRYGTMQVIGTVVDECLSGLLQVDIQQKADLLVLLPERKAKACYDMRITIRTDGSGGMVETRSLKASEFTIAGPGHDWGLTPR